MTLVRSLVLLFFVQAASCEQEKAEQRLYAMVLGRMDINAKLARPVKNYDDPVNVSVGDEKAQVIILNMWLTYKWNDYNFRWEPREYDNIESIRVPPSMMWKPDVLLYNSVDESFDSTYPSNVIVQHDGSMEWIPPGIIKCTCKIDITWFPFDEQKCPMKFGSWTYSGLMLDLQAGVVDTSTYTQNGEWTLVDVQSERNEFKYDCCPEPYIDVTFTVRVRRRTLYYGLNMIIPCLLMAILTLYGFTLPPGPKLGLGVTIFMSLIMFLLMVAESTPSTSEAVPLIGIFFSSIMIAVAVSVAATVFMLNFHHRKPHTHVMSAPIRAIFLCWLPWLLWMDRPQHSRRCCQLQRNDELKDTETGPPAQLHSGELSPSLLANIKDISDPSVPFQNVFHELSLRVSLADPLSEKEMEEREKYIAVAQNVVRVVQSLCSDLMYVVKRMKKEDDTTEVINDWMFAAKVVDRLSLVLFTSILLFTTGGILFSAPYIL